MHPCVHVGRVSYRIFQWGREIMLANGLAVLDRGF